MKCKARQTPRGVTAERHIWLDAEDAVSIPVAVLSVKYTILSGADILEMLS